MTRTLSDLLREARASVPEVGPADAELLVVARRPAHRRP